MTVRARAGGDARLLALAHAGRAAGEPAPRPREGAPVGQRRTTGPSVAGSLTAAAHPPPALQNARLLIRRHRHCRSVGPSQPTRGRSVSGDPWSVGLRRPVVGRSQETRRLTSTATEHDAVAAACAPDQRPLKRNDTVNRRLCRPTAKTHRTVLTLASLVTFGVYFSVFRIGKFDRNQELCK